ncbi:MAG TPA: pectin methylesterase [Clostridiales bacterium]|nr:pectin methylesterase [Clostridiales bacterium]
MILKYITVSITGDGDYVSLQEAIDSLGPEGGRIHIKNGIYYEKIHVRTNNITLIGEDPEKTILTFDDYALKETEEGEKLGTFRSYSFYIGAENFIAKNLTIQNTAGPGSKAGQAVAVYVDADRVAFYHCFLKAWQDTLFLSPLPPSPIIPGSFKGPGKNQADLCHRSYFYDCSIQGDVDFIFGGGIAYFDQCKIISNDLNKDINGYVTAASTPQGQPWGFVFHRCSLVSDCKPNSVYLGRPWRNYAKTAFISCDLGAHICKEGWHNWNKPESEATVCYEEYASVGAGANSFKRVPWSRQLSSKEAQTYTVLNVLSGDDGWNPTLL